MTYYYHSSKNQQRQRPITNDHIWALQVFANRLSRPWQNFLPNRYPLWAKYTMPNAKHKCKIGLMPRNLFDIEDQPVWVNPSKGNVCGIHSSNVLLLEAENICFKSPKPNIKSLPINASAMRKLEPPRLNRKAREHKMMSHSALPNIVFPSLPFSRFL